VPLFVIPATSLSLVERVHDAELSGTLNEPRLRLKDGRKDLVEIGRLLTEIAASVRLRRQPQRDADLVDVCQALGEGPANRLSASSAMNRAPGIQQPGPRADYWISTHPRRDRHVDACPLRKYRPSQLNDGRRVDLGAVRFLRVMRERSRRGHRSLAQGTRGRNPSRSPSPASSQRHARTAISRDVAALEYRLATGS
jgi:hypothetical protein